MSTKKESLVSKVQKTGELIEVLYLPDEEKTCLALCKEEEITLHESLTLDGRIFVPFDADSSLIKNNQVLFPSAVGKYGSTQLLLEDIRTFVHKYVHIPKMFEVIACHYILLSWLYDKFHELPYLRVLGDYGSGKSRFLQTIGSICYKPMFLNGGASSAAIFRTIDLIRGTLVLDEADFNDSGTQSDIAKILNCGFASNTPIMKCEKVKENFVPASYYIFGPKALGGRAPFKDYAIESRCFTTYMERTDRKDIPLNLDDTFWSEALSLRNKLLKYRFDNYNRRFDFNINLDKKIEPRLRQISTPILSVIEDEAVRSCVITFISEYNKQIIQDRGYSFEAEVFRALIEAKEDDSEPTIKQIADKANEILNYSKDCSPRSIGHLIRNSFRLETERRRQGFVVQDIEENAKKIEKLKIKFGISDDEDFLDDESVNDVNIVDQQILEVHKIFGTTDEDVATLI